MPTPFSPDQYIFINYRCGIIPEYLPNVNLLFVGVATLEQGQRTDIHSMRELPSTDRIDVIINLPARAFWARAGARHAKRRCLNAEFA